MLPKKRRVSRKEFGLLEKADLYGSNDLFSFRAKKTDASLGKVSFSVSKKVSKSAVVRNRLRRFGYRAILKMIDKLKNMIIVFYFKKIPENFDETEKSLEKVLIKYKITK